MWLNERNIRYNEFLCIGTHWVTKLLFFDSSTLPPGFELLNNERGNFANSPILVVLEDPIMINLSGLKLLFLFFLFLFAI